MQEKEDIFIKPNKLLFMSPKEPENIAEALKTNPELCKLVKEYYQLINQANLSEMEADRISKIFKLAEHDELLDKCIDKIEEHVSIIKQLQNNNFSIEEFIDKVESVSPKEMNPKKFKELVSQLTLSPNFLRKYIEFKDNDYNRKLIFQTSFGCAYTISWKPGQKTEIHSDNNSYGIIKVYKGTLKHTIYKEFNHLNDIKAYRPIQESQFTAEQWVCVDLSQSHQLSNETNENLVTLHFRYFKDSIEDESSLPGCPKKNQDAAVAC